MSTYTVRGLLTGALYGHHLSTTEAASVVLRHATRRYAIRRSDEGCYWLWVEINNRTMEIANSRGRPIGAPAETKKAAWPAIASQVLEAEWPGIHVSADDEPSLRLISEKSHAA